MSVAVQQCMIQPQKTLGTKIAECTFHFGPWNIFQYFFTIFPAFIGPISEIKVFLPRLTHQFQPNLEGKNIFNIFLRFFQHLSELIKE